jgi:uncharacterized transporter YbjL
MPPESHEVDIALLKKEMEQMRSDVAEIKDSVESLVDAWKAAGVLVSAVKMAAAVVLAIGVIIGSIKFGISPTEAK